MSFEDALSGLRAVETDLVDGGTPAQRTDEATHSTFPKFFLTVQDDQVQVVYGVDWCLHVVPGTRVITAMIGDKWRVGQTVRYPKVVSLAGTQLVQTNHFGGVIRVKAKELDTIIDELETGGNNETLVAADAELEDITALRILPVHPKLALLFLRGMSALKAAKLVQKIFSQVATVEEEGVVALVNFVRAACTGAGTASVAKTKWVPVDPNASDRLYEWCEGQKRPFGGGGPVLSLPPPFPVIHRPREATAPGDTAITAMLERVAESIEVMPTSGGGGKGAAKWAVSDLERYAKLAGLAAVENPTSAIMTAFYQGLERDHNNVAKSRIYVESRLMVTCEPGHWVA